MKHTHDLVLGMFIGFFLTLGAFSLIIEREFVPRSALKRPIMVEGALYKCERMRR